MFHTMVALLFLKATLSDRLLYTDADLKIFLYVCVHIKTIPWKCRFLNKEFLSHLLVKFINFFKNRLIFISFYCCFWVFVNKLFTYLTCASQYVKGALLWNLRHIVFMWRRRYWQIFKSVLVYLEGIFNILVNVHRYWGLGG